jgi:KDO2-lipid IV(A) lauroyltransferase
MSKPRIGKRLRHWAEYVAFRTLVCFVQALPAAVCSRLAEFLAAIIHQVVPRKLTRYQVAFENIRRAYPDRSDARIDRMILAMWRNLFRMVFEIMLLPRKLRLDNVVEILDFRDRKGVVSALCSGRPVLVLSAHYGNWEMAVSIFGLFAFRMGVVARDLDNPFLDRWFRAFRRYTGHQLISKSGGANTMVSLLERNGALALLGDQDAGSSGLFVDFFGRPASTFKSIGLLALEYGALICVGYARRLEGQISATGLPRFELGCEEIIDPREHTSANALTEITQRYTAAIERVVRRAPEQYFWLHRRWKSLPKARQARRKAG